MSYVEASGSGDWKPPSNPAATPVGTANRAVPTSNVIPPDSRLTRFPETVTPGAPALKVAPSTTANDDCGWICTPRPSMLYVVDG